MQVIQTLLNTDAILAHGEGGEKNKLCFLWVLEANYSFYVFF